MARRYGFQTPALLAGLIFGASSLAAAQGVPVVIPGINGTIVTKTTHVEEWAAAKLIVDKTGEGASHALGMTGDIDKLQGLHEGSTVLVHYAVAGQAQALNADSVADRNYLNVTEGVIWRIDRPREQIAIKYGNGRIENYRLAEHAVVRSGTDVNQPAAGAKRIKVSYKDGQGRPIQQYFKKKAS